MKMGKVEKSLIIESYITRRKTNPAKEDNEKKKKKDSIRRVSLILRKSETLRTAEEKNLLETNAEVAKQISKRKERIQLYKERVIEKEDSLEIIERKAKKLAEIIYQAKHLVCYTGAGISTSARIPDYRGSKGIWTLMQQGKDIGQHDLSLADPTYTHMALYELHRRKMLRYVVSQNCDGLHLRAGLPKYSLSEVHGNMYIEVCKNCKPNVEYWRLFDTTELTSRFYHKTNRRCHICLKPLVDTIVHFGERGILKWPLNWGGACHHSEKADVILCLGSSLKVLKKYSWLWQMDRSQKKRAKICIVNLQWTPKDRLSSIKINGKCDDVMRLVMKYLNISVPPYDRKYDPIFAHATLLSTEELHTVSQPMLKISKEITKCDNDNIQNPSNIQPWKGCIRKRMKRPCPPVSMKRTSYVKTNINSRHLILTEETTSTSNDESDSDECKPENDSKNENMVESIHEADDTKITDIHMQSYAMHNKEVNGECKSQNLDREIKEESQLKDEINNFNETKNPLDSTLGCDGNINEMTQLLEKQKLEEGDGDVRVTCDMIENKQTELLSSQQSTQLNNFGKQISISNNEFSFKGILHENIRNVPKGAIDKLKSQVTIAEDCYINKLPSYDATFCLNAGKQSSLYTNICDYNTSNIINYTSGFNPSQLMKEDIKTSSVYANAFKFYQKHFNIRNESFGFHYDTFNVEQNVNPVEINSLASADSYYRNFLEYFKVVDSKMPFWYDVNYAYSGLHSIIQPPPPDIDLWSSITVPIFQMNRTEAECEFCFDNYAEFTCQFYKKRSSDFIIKKYRNGNLIVCECCDFSDEEESQNDCYNKKSDKRAKIDMPLFNPPVKVQAGWYGKGCRKNFRKKKK